MLYMLGAATGAAPPPAWISWLPIVGMILIFWFLIIRPQMKQQKAHQQKVAGLKRVQPFAQHPFVVGHRHLTSPSARPVVHARRKLFAAVPAYIEAQ